MPKLQETWLRYAWRRIDNWLTAGINPDPIVLCNFRSKADVDRWRVFSDAAFGGSSRATLELAPDGQSAVFSGRYSKTIQDAAHLVRSGYCGMNLVRSRNLNLAMHDFLDFRVRGDGHTYIASIRVDQLTGGDEEAWQAPLITRHDGQWDNVRVELDDFIFSFRGRLAKQPDAVGSMQRERVMSVGITLAASEDMPPEGDFRLELDSVVAGAYEPSGPEARRKAFRGDLDVRYDPMWERPKRGQAAGAGGGVAFGGRQQQGPELVLGGRGVGAKHGGGSDRGGGEGGEGALGASGSSSRTASSSSRTEGTSSAAS